MKAQKSLRKGDSVVVSFDTHGYRFLTKDEVEKWNNSPAAWGIGEDGETKLPPVSYCVELSPFQTYTVVNARCRARVGYGLVMRSSALIRDFQGNEFYVRREYMHKVERGTRG